MPQSVENAIRVYLAPILAAALIAVCGVLWFDMRDQVNALTAKVAGLNDTVVRLTTIEEGR